MYERFEELLLRKGVKTADVCKATGITQTTMSDWKHGRSKPKAEKMALIAEYFQVSVGYLLGIEDDMHGRKEEPKQEEQKSEEEYYLNQRTRELAKFAYENPEYAVLFDATRRVKPSDLKFALRAIGIFIDEE